MITICSVASGNYYGTALEVEPSKIAHVGRKICSCAFQEDIWMVGVIVEASKRLRLDMVVQLI